MSLADATPEELAQVNDYTIYLRGLSGEFMRLMNKMNAAQNTWNETIAPIIGTPTGTVINDSSGLTGIAPLTDDDITTITSYFEGTLSNYYIQAAQQLLTKAAGTSNTTG